jgi:hypothetical protein
MACASSARLGTCFGTRRLQAVRRTSLRRVSRKVRTCVLAHRLLLAGFTYCGFHAPHTDGDEQWIRVFGSLGDDVTGSLAVSSTNEIYVSLVVEDAIPLHNVEAGHIAIVKYSECACPILCLMARVLFLTLPYRWRTDVCAGCK